MRSILGCIISSALVLLVAAQQMSLVAQAAPEQRLRDFKELLEVARRLESNGLQVNEDSDHELVAKRKELLFAFARESKSAHTNKHYQQMLKIASEYKVNFLQYVQECRKPKGNWFTKVFNLGPLGSLKALSKSNDLLSAFTATYEKQCKQGQLFDPFVVRDLAQYQIGEIDSIMFVLATEIKYLTIETIQLLNSAIYRQLEEDKFVVNNNFYDVEQLTETQQNHLRDLFVSKLDASQVKIGDAVEHYQNPSNLVIGRLLDTCHSLNFYQNEWTQLLPDCGAFCDPDGALVNKHKERFGDINQFCETFLDAL